MSVSTLPGNREPLTNYISKMPGGEKHVGWETEPVQLVAVWAQSSYASPLREILIACTEPNCLEIEHAEGYTLIVPKLVAEMLTHYADENTWDAYPIEPWDNVPLTQIAADFRYIWQGCNEEMPDVLAGMLQDIYYAAHDNHIAPRSLLELTMTLWFDGNGSDNFDENLARAIATLAT